MARAVLVEHDESDVVVTAKASGESRIRHKVLEDGLLRQPVPCLLLHLRESETKERTTRRSSGSRRGLPCSPGQLAVEVERGRRRSLHRLG